MPLKRNKAEQAPRPPRPPKSGRRQPARDGAGASDSKKSGRFVLIIGDDGAILIFMQGNTVVRRLFAPSPRPDHTASIVELMQANPNVPLSILADVIDQQYVRHNFPPVSALSVNNLVKRRIERDFQAEDLTGLLRTGREKSGRKEWSYLLIALANTPLMQQWLELLIELPNELKGIFLTPLEAQYYIPALKKQMNRPAMPWQLLLTHNKVSGFRQVVLRDGKLVFTRVTQAIDDGVPAVIAGNIEQEVIGTIEYLRRLGFQDNETLEILVIAAQEVKESLDLERFHVRSYEVFTPLDVADMLNLQQAALSADRFGDVVMASWFALAKKHTLKFNTAYGEKLAKFYGARRALKIAGGLLVFALLGLAAMNVKDAIVIGGEASEMELQRAPQQNEMAKLQKSLDSLDEDVAFKTAVTSVNDVYMKNAKSPLDFATELAKNSSTMFRIKKISWSEVGNTSAAAGAQAAPTPAAGTTAAQPGDIEVNVTVDIYGRFPDIEALTRATDDYVDGLRGAMSDYTIISEPYSWMQNSSDSMEISFDQKTAESTDSLGDRTIELTFKTKSKTDTAPPGVGTAPGMAPGMGPGMGMGPGPGPGRM